MLDDRAERDNVPPMSDTTGTTLSVTFTDQQIEAIDAWIARHPAPAPTREAAVRELIAGRLGAHGPSTVLPGLVTGRDIV